MKLLMGVVASFAGRVGISCDFRNMSGHRIYITAQHFKLSWELTMWYTKASGVSYKMQENKLILWTTQIINSAQTEGYRITTCTNNVPINVQELVSKATRTIGSSALSRYPTSRWCNSPWFSIVLRLLSQYQRRWPLVLMTLLTSCRMMQTCPSAYVNLDVSFGRKSSGIYRSVKCEVLSLNVLVDVCSHLNIWSDWAFFRNNAENESTHSSQCTEFRMQTVQSIVVL